MLTLSRQVVRVHHNQNHKSFDLINQTIITATQIALDHNHPITTEMEIALDDHPHKTALELYEITLIHFEIKNK